MNLQQLIIQVLREFHDANPKASCMTKEDFWAHFPNISDEEMIECVKTLELKGLVSPLFADNTVYSITLNK